MNRTLLEELGPINASYDLGEISFAAVDGLAIEASASGDAPKFEMVAYNGGPMELGKRYPVIVDLEGVYAARDPLPIIRDHDRKQRVGHGSMRIEGGRILVGGVLSGKGPAASEVIAELRDGFPYQSSIGATPQAARLVKRGETVFVNGRTHKGPVIVSTRTRLNEVSCVTEGADNDTATRLAASKEGQTMNFDQWLESLGIEASALTEKQRKSLEQTYKIEKGELQATVVGAGAGGGGRTGSGGADELADLQAQRDQLIKEIRAEHGGEQERIAGIRKLCGEANADIAAEAIRNGDSVEQTELRLLRASRPTLEAHTRAGTTNGPVNLAVLEAAVMCSLGYDDEITAEAFGEKVMDQAGRFRGIGLKDLCILAARNDNADVPAVFGTGDAVIEAATSTRSLASVVSNSVQKIAMRVYEQYPIVGVNIARHRNVSDFKQVESYRLNGTGKWDKVGKDGKLSAGKLDDDRYTDQAETYGQTIGIDRRDIINDDLGILTDIGTLMGQSGASLIDELLFTKILDNPSNFFHADNDNLLEGADTAMGVTGLQKARQNFRKKKSGPGAKSKDKRPIAVMPRILLVPPELETDAENLMLSRQLNLRGDTDSERPSDNPFRNKYKLMVSPHLSDDSISGNSATAWYLLAEPSMVPAFSLAFLNGVKTPTIRRVQGPHDQLGVFYHGYFDVGASLADPKGAVKATGVSA